MWENFWQLFNKTKILNFTFNLKNNPLAILDILIVALLFYWLYKMIKGTRGMRIAIGIVILGGILAISKILGLYTLNWLLRQALTVVLVAIPIVFQPELRRALEKLGRAHFISEFSGKEETSFPLDEIVEACRTMSKDKIGALIVIKRKTGLDDYLERGVKVGGEVSSHLLLSIFFPGSPLHDGAVIIDGRRILAASVMLPLADSEESTALGARHRAALGLSSETDAVVIVVSEENGRLSLAYDGKITHRLTVEKLAKLLRKLLKKK